MRRPSITNLKDYFQNFDVTDEQLRKLSKMLYETEKKLGAKDADLAMQMADRVLGGFGVEPLRGDWVSNYWWDTNALYVNTGDTYSPTILYDTRRGKFYVTTFGDWVEAEERRP